MAASANSDAALLVPPVASASRVAVRAVGGAVLSVAISYLVLGNRHIAGFAIGAVAPWVVYWIAASSSEPFRRRRRDRQLVDAFHARLAVLAEVLPQRRDDGIDLGHFDAWRSACLERRPLAERIVTASEVRFGDILVDDDEFHRYLDMPGEFLTSSDLRTVSAITLTGAPGDRHVRIDSTPAHNHLIVGPTTEMRVLRAACAEPASGSAGR